MEEDILPRKLAVILHADVVGSTELVRINETLAHERIQNIFHRFSTTIDSYGGTAHELRGDALVAEFERASDAVAAALTFQAENTRFDSSPEDEIQPQLRIGISMGEVVIADNTITGAGVVLAQRLEQLAESGGVCIQGAAYETVPQRLPFEYKSLGEQQVKGFDEPVRAYAVTLKPGEIIVAPEPSAKALEIAIGKPMWPRVVGVVVALFIVVVVGLAWWQPWQPQKEPVSSLEPTEYPLPDKPSVAVLPFVNMSDDSEQEYFVDGITGDLITALSEFKFLFIIASNSSFSYKGKPVKVQEVSRELGVRYVVEGSVQRAGDRIRVNAQLIDATTGKHLWAERYDRDAQQLFDIQDEIVETIVATLAFKVDEAERDRVMRKGPKNLDAYDYWLRGRNAFFHFTKEANARAASLYTKAIELDPSWARPYCYLAWPHVQDFRYGWSEDPDKSMETALELAQKCYALDPDDYKTPWTLGFVYLYLREFDRAIAEYDRALELNSNDADFLAEMSNALIYTGRLEQAVSQIKQAMRMNPRHPSWYFQILGLAYYETGRYEEALATLKQNNKPSFITYRNLAAVYVRLGQLEQAGVAVSELLKNKPDYKSGAENLRPYKDQAQLDRFINDLRKAGVPD